MSMDERQDSNGGLTDEEMAGIADGTSDEGIEAAKRIAEEEEAGYRHLTDYTRYIVPSIAIIWCIFQLSIASWWLLDTVVVRAVHLTFAMLITFLSYPALKKPRKGALSFLSARTYIPFSDYLMAAAGCFAALYIVIDLEAMASRMGAPILRDIVIGMALVLILLEAARRVIGPALTIIASMFSLYVFFAEYMPEFMAFKSASLSKYVGKIAM